MTVAELRLWALGLLGIAALAAALAFLMWVAEAGGRMTLGTFGVAAIIALCASAILLRARVLERRALRGLEGRILRR